MFSNRILMSIVILVAATLLVPAPAQACSAFVTDGGGPVLFGRNFDFFTGTGFVTVNPRSLEKTALVPPPEVPAKWVSHYGSVTFNQVGREFPMGGMNEKGLVVECLWLNATQYPAPDGRAALTELQWIQYCLDTCATVADVLDADRKVRILPSATRLHFLVCDRSGAAAVVEFVGGKTVTRGPAGLPVRALANAVYGDSLEALKGFRGFGGEREIPAAVQENDVRFARMAGALRELSGRAGAGGLDRAFDLLRRSRYDGEESPTQWSIVYEPARGEIHFVTRQAPARQRVRLADFGFDCTTPAKVLALDPPPDGGPARGFTDYDAAVNAAHTRATMAAMKKAGYCGDLPDFVPFILGAYPQTLTCASAEKPGKTTNNTDLH
ncbi:MAG: linear amide C-N hydrolase [Acidobacteria bacterium]|nr:linear amide C-N hydrolase [Acidobacteriota bacterium]